jgi:SAM-dependent methyltransferase
VGGAAYDSGCIAALRDAEERHFWFVARREAVLAVLQRSVGDLATRPLFDVGCGTGSLLKRLSDGGVRVEAACDASEEGLRTARGRLDVPLLLIDEGRLPALARGRTMLSLFDVLEHIDDDAAVFRWAASVLGVGGVIALTVPAYPALFGPVDEMAGHRRRYRRRELRAKLSGAGFEVRVLTHFMSPLLPLLAVIRLLGRRRSGHGQFRSEVKLVPGLNELLGWALAIERPLLGRVAIPFGPSLLAVGVRLASVV